MNSKSKKILIIGINYSPELTGIGRYTGEMGEWLAKNGFKCSVVTSFPYYPNWKVQKPYNGKFYKKEIQNDGNTILYRCPFYVPKNPNGIKRMIQESTFFLSASFVIFYLLFKPKQDYIFCIAPPFHLGFLALFYRFFKGGKIIYHVQDLQIEAAKDLKIVKAKIVFRILFALERFILEKVDFISSISTGMLKKINIKSGKSGKLFPNWVDTTRYFPVSNRELLKKEWGFNIEDKIVLYSGSIGEKQGLDALIDISLRCLSDNNIKFIICGNGPYKQKLEKIAKEKGAKNLFFLPLQENDVFNNFLNFADVHLVLQKREASDLVMPSKLTTILSSGGLVIATALKDTSLFIDITTNKMGIVIPPEDNEILFKTIVDACTKDYSKEKTNARHYAEKFLNKEAILEEMNNSILV